ncbi:MAG: response regulator [Acidobacteriota bacterium]|nr:response regulator [Acidobacteriota bacterium]
MRILVAEDEESVSGLLRVLLAQFNPVVVADGAQAVEAARRERFDFILLDLMMPVMGGDDAAVLIRAADADVPIAFFTGYGDEARRRAGVLAVRPVAVWVKPNDLGEMVDAIAARALEASHVS